MGSYVRGGWRLRQIGLVWAEVLKCGDGSKRVLLGADLNPEARELLPSLAAKEKGCPHTRAARARARARIRSHDTRMRMRARAARVPCARARARAHALA